ncbi:MAG: nucleotidyltransferase [Candidatus Wallbacteria bacterium HGW-Wallbacteria-1]|jgi:hypothetical protein|uniref:Nucleotidyltransferase n=1 Tax=Candidatus Wallbacteria bacterium HGW-Wallbacteria-1 TaxID=2013854 RepID=A0A2N1PIA3_9BACT|nr:MAG: nucleotidyltransferase [Candidatus Wallbacteria bacterium HGW-Wallbacteria-1]
MSGINPEIREKITRRLFEIEKEHDVQILFAVESGSRAWGFESFDSDYDVRFIYRHALKWYLNILPKTDVIEYPIVDEFDYSGWDLRKSLFLLNKSNPVIFEWLRSSIVYIRDQSFYDDFFELSNRYFSPVSSIYHYLHMAKGNFRSYLEKEFVKTKKYFYVLRPLLACQWIENFNESPPMEFQRLLDALVIPMSVRDEIDELLIKKKAGGEMAEERQIVLLNTYVKSQIEYFESLSSEFDPAIKPAADFLEDFLYDLLQG